MYWGKGGSALPADLEAPPPPPPALIDAASDLRLAAQIRAQQRLVNQAQHRLTSLVAEFDRRHGFASEGHQSALGWLRSQLHLTAAQSGQQLMLCRRLPQLPLVERSFAAGSISLRHAAQIAGCARRLGADRVAPVEQVLVDLAEQASVQKLALATSHLEHALDPDGHLSFFEEQSGRSRLQMHSFSDGSLALRGLFDPLQGEIVRLAVLSLLSPRSGDDLRPASERRADALVELCRRQLESGPGPRRGAHLPRLTVITSERTLKGLKGAQAAELGGGAAIPGQIARMLACDCELELGHVCRDGRTVRLRGARRLVSRRQFSELLLRDGGCVVEGCQSRWVEAHHIEHWADGGDTRLQNLVLLCRRCHGLAHTRGIDLQLKPGGGFVGRIRPRRM